MFKTPHRRFNPLTGEWVLVSPHRAARPWLGQVEKTPPDRLPAYDPDCYLCPRNQRAGGVFNPDYQGAYVFDNDFAALLPQPLDEVPAPTHPLFVSAPELGRCRVVCFSPRHDLTLPELEPSAIVSVIQTWARESASLMSEAYVQYAQVFENKGAIMGCSNPHPHSQIWAQSQLPNEIVKELAAQSEHYRRRGVPLLIEYIEEELKQKERVLFVNEHFAAVVPYWAVWPFEVLLSARRPLRYLHEASAEEVSALAEILKQITTCYDNLFETSFPYSMGFHQAPAGGEWREWVLHAHFYPPLLRSATVRKFMVGYEMLAMPQRDLAPETAAERLRATSNVHYKMR